MKVVDASAMIDTLTGGERSDQLASILDDDLFAPDLLVAEVLGFLRRMAARDRLSDAESDQLARAFNGAPIEYLHGGYDGIFPLVEQALQGRESPRRA